MHRARLTLLLIALTGLPGMAGCAGASRPATPEFSGTRHVDLTPEQNRVVEAGVREMLQNAQGAKLKAVTAVEIAKLPGIHVCGHVTADAGGRSNRDLPFYVELREADGKPAAERGQVGSDPSKLSKVKFLCRRNQPGGGL